MTKKTKRPADTKQKSTTNRSTATAKSKRSTKQRIMERKKSFLSRRPHRSFQRTRRRDYKRSLELPGYWSFTDEVRRTLWRNKRTFGLLVLVYVVLSGVFVGIASQTNYITLSDTLSATSGDIFNGKVGEIGRASLLLLTGVTGSLGGEQSQVQQLLGVLFGLMAWLTTVWILRSLLAGHTPRLRDALYNAGAPIIPSILVSLLIVVQLLPAALAALAVSAGIGSGFFDSGVEGMVLAVVAVLFGTLSIYWLTSTIIALVVVTLPGMYPMKAIQTAGDLVIGRRLRILLRWIWLGVVIAVSWLIIMVPIIIFDTWLKNIWSAVQWLPIVPLSLLFISSATIVVAASYVYLLYRKVVDDDAKPA